MKFTKSDLKTFLLVMAGVIAALVVIYYGEDNDIPVLKQAHEGAGG